MAGEFSFLNWRRPAIHKLGTAIGTDGRRSGEITLEAQVSGEVTAIGKAPFLVEGPRDIGRIDVSAIIRTAPPANEPAAETTKLVHVDFADADFPWRYTLASPSGADKTLRPWLALVVGADDEISVNGGTMLITKGEFLKEAHYDLSQSWLWAHVQVHQGRELSRLLAPRPLDARKSYTAVLVPAYKDSGADAWSNAEIPQSMRALYSWKFQTTEAGDFETLVSALKVRSQEDLGKVAVIYKFADETESPFTVYGAIGPRVRSSGTNVRIKADLEPKVTEESSGDEAPAIGLPLYGRPWVNAPRSTTWGRQIFDDPALRVPAGIGMWMGIEAQQQLLAAAIEQAGALEIARRRVASLVAGVHTNRSLQKRRLPESPLARLWVLSPAMARLPAKVDGDSTGSVLTTLVDGDSPLPAALFSSAAKRLLKRGGSPTRYSRNPDPENPNKSHGATRDEILTAANTCPPAEVDLEELDAINTLREELKDRIHEYANILRLDVQVISLPPVEPPPSKPCRPRRLEVLVKGVQQALDPTNVVDRVAGTIALLDIHQLAPPELPISLQYPTWLLLKENAPEWLLPGFDQIAKDSVVPLASNPEFIEAFLLGLNTQFKNELLWRQLADAPNSTPLTLFWGTISGKGGLAKRTPDIKPISDWPATSEFGKPEHQVVLPADEQGNRDLVMLLRTDLFRRYPTTQVYLRRIPTDVDAAATGLNREEIEKNWLETIGPGGELPPPIGPAKIDTFPIFQGALSAEIVFFIFNVSPDDLNKFWLMLEEPPADLRFRSPLSMIPPDVVIKTSSANFAKSTLDHPTRVAISWTSLKGAF